MPSQVRCPGPLPWLGMDCRSLARDRASARPCAPHVAGAAVTAFIDLPIPARARVPAMSTCRFPLLVLLLAAASADLAAAILTVGAAGSEGPLESDQDADLDGGGALGHGNARQGEAYGRYEGQNGLAHW